MASSNGRKGKRLLVMVAGVAAAALLLGSVFTTVATNTNTAYAATEDKGKQKPWLPSNFREGAAPIEDPPYLVPFSQAAASVEKASLTARSIQERGV